MPKPWFVTRRASMHVWRILFHADLEETETDEEAGFRCCLDDDRTSVAADEEASQLLQGLRPFKKILRGSGKWIAGPDAVQPPGTARKRGRPVGSKKREDPLLWEAKEVSVTITAGSCDIDPGKLDDMELFLEAYCMAGLFALERGGTVCHLHLQGILRMRAKTVRGISAALKAHLGWDKGRQPVGSRVMCRSVTNNKLHTWPGLVGYCCKDLHEDHFQVCRHRVHPPLSLYVPF